MAGRRVSRRARRPRLLPVAATALIVLGVLLLAVIVTAAIGERRGPDDDAAVGDFQPLPAQPPAGPDASTGSWTSRCGHNTDGHYNSDNVIVSPGKPGAAEHLHDYVGNLSTAADSTLGSLRRAGTSCANGDRSSYFWPVLRLQDARTGDRPTDDRAGVVVPRDVRISFLGNAAGKVLPMPDFLRMTSGDARAVLHGTGGTADPRAWWGCAGVPAEFTSRYPLCPAGQQTVRTFDFPSCWDGANTDSPDHRTHIRFPAGNGACPDGTFPVPRLRVTVSYLLPQGRPFAIDAIPGQHRAASTDHGHFIEVMSPALQHRVVDCINSGRHC